MSLGFSCVKPGTCSSGAFLAILYPVSLGFAYSHFGPISDLYASTWTPQAMPAKISWGTFTPRATILDVQRHLRTLPIAPQAPRVVRWSTPLRHGSNLIRMGHRSEIPGAAAAGIIRDADGQ
ncbi:UNVERIFIED_CONTAM: hypothetical protein Sindi_2645900, partial [Sesamum indicum]